MHSMHALPAHPDLHQHQLDQQQQHHLQRQQQLELHHQQQQLAQHHHQQQPANSMARTNEPPAPNSSSAATNTSTMTTLESLAHSHVQQSIVDEQQPQVLMEQPAHLVQQQQHLVQQQHSPQLHQLQPPPRTLCELTTSGARPVEFHEDRHEHHEQQQLDGQQQQVGRQANSSTAGNQSENSLRQRTQIEGIVADGGGPIVHWLLENYEIADGESLPRSTVYNHYLAHCRQLQMASVNAASFGKLIRSVFVGLKTRRLGTRGHSKYHYFGVRAKSHIKQELLQHQETSASCSRDENSNHNTEHTGSDADSLTNGMDCGRLTNSATSLTAATPTKRAKRGDGSTQNGGGVYSNTRRSSHQYYADTQEHYSTTTDIQDQHHHLHMQHQMQPADQEAETASGQLNGATSYLYNNGLGAAVDSHHPDHHASEVPPIVHHHRFSSDQLAAQPISSRDLIDFRNYLGANWTTLVDEHWPPPEQQLAAKTLVGHTGAEVPLASSMEAFEAKYKGYYKRMVELLSELKFSEIEPLWQEFWHPNHESEQSKAMGSGRQNGCSSDNNQYQTSTTTNLTFNLLYQLTSQPAIIERICRIDYTLYAALETFLLPDMLSPIPRPLAQHIRLFAKNVGLWAEQSIKDYNLSFVAEKSKSARSFGYSLRRCTSLNHLSTASRAIWGKRTALAQMSMDLLRVDLRDIEHQVSLMGNGESHHDLAMANTGHSNSNNHNDDAANGNCHQGIGDGNLGSSHQHEVSQFIDHQHHLHHQQQQHLFAMQPAQLIQNFLALLEDSYPANSWPDWCRNLVESRVSGVSLDEARNFLFKWNFYISLIMKELTLKSAPSLGSFQLIRLLFDEYMYYLVVSRLAQAQHKTPAQLMRPNSN